IRLAVFVDGGRHGNDVNVAAVQAGRIVAERQALGGGQFAVTEFAGEVVPVAQVADAVPVHIEAHHRAVFAELGGQGQADIAEADDGQFDVFQDGVDHSFGTLSFVVGVGLRPLA